jgi:hypothetical protein
MNPQYEKQLEACVRRELDALGELPTPPALARRIMRSVEQRVAVPWYRQAWSGWPLGWRLASLTTLLLAFGGLCWGSGLVTHGMTAPTWMSALFEDAGALWRTAVVLGNTVASLLSQLGTGVLVGGAAVMFAAWVMCIGLGTAYVRLAMRPAVNRI